MSEVDKKKAAEILNLCITDRTWEQYSTKRLADTIAAALAEARAETWERAIEIAKSKTWFGDREHPVYLDGVVEALEAAKDGR